jgi:hypothetical protein
MPFLFLSFQESMSKAIRKRERRESLNSSTNEIPKVATNALIHIETETHYSVPSNC